VGYRKVPNSLPLRVEWVGRAFAPGEERQQEETFQEIAQGQTYAMLSDMSGPQAAAMKARYPQHLDPRQKLEELIPSSTLVNLYKQYQRRYGPVK
jgi:hypothetical protein